MVILPGVSVIVESYSGFFFVLFFCFVFFFFFVLFFWLLLLFLLLFFRERKGEIRLSHTGDYTNTPLCLQCRHLSQYFHVGLMGFNPLMPSGVVHPYQLDESKL